MNNTKNSRNNPSLLEEYPDLVETEWSAVENYLLGRSPQLLHASSGKDTYWTCPNCGSTYHASPRTRTSGIRRNKTTCHHCRGKVQYSPFIV